MGKKPLTVSNLLKYGTTLYGQINTDAVVTIGDTYSSHDFSIEKGDMLTLYTTSSDALRLDAYQVADKFTMIGVIIDANGVYHDTYGSQPFGVNNILDYEANINTLSVSLSPPYFVTLTGSAPGTFIQYDGTGLLYDPSSTYFSYWWIVVILVILAIIIVVGVGFYYQNHKKINSQ